ncbi:angiopoietin-1 receptor-like isoform X2 [Mercenaria mercenaria]|uniref:angiopoietin-1 receptor-like isoform X2 n=1 Tax=Mercenaria mercenaria TaxID=6596 RepID=UPI00234EC43E|nr:angiopoietin-1 receptor-like isoform X2 [Mercenaria mercenaria]
MDIMRHVYVLLFIIVHAGHVHCDHENITTDIPDETLIYARCLARCYDLYGQATDRSGEQYASKVCDSPACLQCLLPCNVSTVMLDKCGNDLCGEDDRCLSSCAFLQNVHEEFKSLQDTKQRDSLTDLKPPEIVCKNVPYGRNNCPDPIATMYLKLNDRPALDKTAPVFIISARYIHEWNEISNWTKIETTTETFVKIKNLRCSTAYQFRVTAVLSNGMYGQSRPSAWSKTPGYNYTPEPPKSLTVSEPSLVNLKPSVTVTWDPGTETPCYYKIFWFDQTVYMQAEIKVPRQFSYQIDNLKFSKNYTIRLYSIDDAFQHTSEDKRVYAITPDCLEATGYNHSVCAPEKPHNLTLDVLTPSHKDVNVRYVNVTLSWEAPTQTHNGDDVLRYILVYRKEPPYDVAKHLEPHKAEVYLNGSKTSVTLVNLHNHNLYSFELSAVTTGGKGDSEFIKVYIGLYTPEETGTEEPGIPQQTEQDSSSGLSVTEILSVVLVPVVLFVILIFAIGFIIAKRRRKYKKYPSQRRFGPVEEMNPIYDGMALNIDSTKAAQFAMDGYEIDYSCLDFISVIGEGAFGKVVKAEYYPNPSDRGNQQGKIVAVKMLRDFYTGDESRNFLLEIQAMKNLGHYPYIVSIIGCCLTGPKLCLIMDYCALGDLRNYLRKYREKLMYSMSSPYGLMTKAPNCYMQDQMFRPEKQTSDGSGNSDLSEAADVSEAQLLSYARQVTMGMEFLEQRKFVHRDLAARNILLYDHRHAKISDFGLTRDVYETNVYQPTSARKLPYKWMAIESLFSQRFTVKSDVWSFGIVLWEIVTLGGSPYPSIPLKDLYGLLNDGYRMEKPENCSTKIYQIMLSCWHPNPHSRPTFSQLRQELEKLLEETMSYIDLSVEVSEDYFNESTNESNVVGYQTSDSKDTVLEMDADKSPEFTENQKLFVDIHKQPKSIDTLHESNAGNDMSEERMLYNDSDYLESTLNRTCDFCGEERPLLSGNQPNKIVDCKKCILCSNDNMTTSVDSLKGKPCHLVKSVFQDSLRSLLDNVANESTFSKPSSKKLCVSLTDINDDKDIHSTSL